MFFNYFVFFSLGFGCGIAWFAYHLNRIKKEIDYEGKANPQ